MKEKILFYPPPPLPLLFLAFRRIKKKSWHGWLLVNTWYLNHHLVRKWRKTCFLCTTWNSLWIILWKLAEKRWPDAICLHIRYDIKTSNRMDSNKAKNLIGRYSPNLCRFFVLFMTSLALLDIPEVEWLLIKLAITSYLQKRTEKKRNLLGNIF